MQDRITLAAMDRRARLARAALVNGALAALVIGLYCGLIALGTRVGLHTVLPLQLLATAIVAISAVPLRRRLQALVNRLVYPDWQSSQDLLREVGEALSRTIEPEGLHALLVDELPARLRMQSATLWMLEPPDDRVFVALGQAPDSPGATLLANGASTNQVQRAARYLTIPAPQDNAWAAPFIARGVRLVIPLRRNERLIGIYGCGPPASGRDYPRRVLDMLLTLAPAIASALENTRAYTTIARLNRELRTLDQLKDAFIESVGHELRTPLTSLSLTLELLALQPDMAPVLQGIARESVVQLQALVERVLAFDQRLDRSQPEPGGDAIAIELATLVEDIVADHHIVAQVKRLRFVLQIPAGLAVWGDYARLRRALHEVIDNAVRYSERGEITLSALVQDGLAIISVADQGPGIPADERDRLFTAFYRGRGARALAKTPGAGLGLSIAQRDIEALGGRIWLERSDPNGSVMCIALPATTHNAVASTAQERAVGV